MFYIYESLGLSVKNLPAPVYKIIMIISTFNKLNLGRFKILSSFTGTYSGSLQDIFNNKTLSRLKAFKLAQGIFYVSGFSDFNVRSSNFNGNNNMFSGSLMDNPSNLNYGGGGPSNPNQHFVGQVKESDEETIPNVKLDRNISRKSEEDLLKLHNSSLPSISINSERLSTYQPVPYVNLNHPVYPALQALSLNPVPPIPVEPVYDFSINESFHQKPTFSQPEPLGSLSLLGSAYESTPDDNGFFGEIAPLVDDPNKSRERGYNPLGGNQPLAKNISARLQWCAEMLGGKVSPAKNRYLHPADRAFCLSYITHESIGKNPNRVLNTETFRALFFGLR